MPCPDGAGFLPGEVWGLLGAAFQFTGDQVKQFMGCVGSGEFHALVQRNSEPVQLGGGHERPAPEGEEDP
jgi:hypothetical protein